MKAWPALSETYGLHPWDVRRLSVAELNAYVKALEESAKAAKRRR